MLLWLQVFISESKIRSLNIFTTISNNYVHLEIRLHARGMIETSFAPLWLDMNSGPQSVHIRPWTICIDPHYASLMLCICTWLVMDSLTKILVSSTRFVHTTSLTGQLCVEATQELMLSKRISSSLVLWTWALVDSACVFFYLFVHTGRILFYVK